MTDDVTGKKMVAGFLFSGPRVLLVKKRKPAWQYGLLNGVGGVINPSETPIEAMNREFREETQTNTDLAIDWRHFATEIGPFGSYVYFFHAKIERRDVIWPEKNDVGEDLFWLHWLEVAGGRRSAVGNLRWLLPLALDWRGFVQPVTVDVKKDIREKATW